MATTEGCSAPGVNTEIGINITPERLFLQQTGILRQSN